MIKKTIQIIGLLLLLPAGAVAVIYLSSLFRHRYDDSGFGFFRGHVHGVFCSSSWHGLEVSFEGDTPSQWRWTCPENYTYQSLDIQWQGNETKVHGKLILPSCVLQRPDSSGGVRKDDLRELLIGGEQGKVSPATRQLVEQVYQFAVDAGIGKLPPPRHHPYDYEEPGKYYGKITHFSLGWRFPHSLLVWMLVWCCFVVFCITRWAKRKRIAELNDRRSQNARR